MANIGERERERERERDDPMREEREVARTIIP